MTGVDEDTRREINQEVAMKKILFTCVLIMVLVLIVAAPVSAKNKTTKWFVPGDFATIQEAIDSADVADGDIIMVDGGNHSGALVTKAVQIRGTDNAVINDGPLHSSGLIQGFRLLEGADGASISHLRFEGVDLVIMNGEAVDGVTVEHCIFINPIQAVSNWRGSEWTISHNKITDLRTRNGGGIGILIGDYSGGVVKDNVVSHNTISGMLYVAADDGGGYNGSGVVIYADFRWGRAGAEEISGNRVVQNRVSLVSDTPEVVDVVACELTDSRDNESIDPVIFGNAIGFNDFRGTELQIDLTPDNLDEYNTISRNLGDNRGHGAHPSVFGTGGN
jgi:hypothetical protein